MGLEKEKKRKRRIGLVVALIAILLVTVFLFARERDTNQNGENYLVRVEDEVCNVTVTETLPSKLHIYIDSQVSAQEKYVVLIEKNVTFHVAQEIESIPKINCTEKESSILYSIRIENYSFSLGTIITIKELEYASVLSIRIEEPFVSFFMQFETYKEDG